MKIFWRVIDAVLEAVLVVILLCLSGLAKTSNRLAASRRTYDIKRYFDGDKAAYERDRWKNS